MKSPYNPLAPPGPRRFMSVRNVLIALVVGCVVMFVAQSRTIRLEGAGPLGKIDVEVKVKASLNGIRSIMKGGRLVRKRVEEISVRNQNQPGTWVTRDQDLRNIGDWDRRVTRNGWFRLSGGCLYLVMDDKRINSETSSMIIGLPERYHQVTKMEYWGSAHDQEFELVWVER